MQIKFEVEPSKLLFLWTSPRGVLMNAPLGTINASSSIIEMIQAILSSSLICIWQKKWRKCFGNTNLHETVCFVMSAQLPSCCIHFANTNQPVNILDTQWRTQKIFMGGFIQWQMMVICIWCALLVTSQFDVIFMFSSEVCWHNRHILLHTLLFL